MPTHLDELLQRVVAYATVAYSALFGGASLMQALGIVLPIAFLIYKWYVDRLRHKAILHVLAQQENEASGRALQQLRQIGTKPGDL